MLVLSQYVEQLYARELLADRSGGVGYLLKDRVGQVDEFLDAVVRVAAGGCVIDPEVVITPGIYVDRVVRSTINEKWIEKLTVRQREA